MTATPSAPGVPAPSARASELHTLLLAFMRDRVLLSEHAYEQHRATAGAGDHSVPPVVEELKAEAKGLGLWNLFLPAESGLTQLEDAPLAELSGWSNDIAPKAIVPAQRARVAASRRAQQLMVDDEVLEACGAGSFAVGRPHAASRAVVTMCTALPHWFDGRGPATAEQIASSTSSLSSTSCAARLEPVEATRPTQVIGGP